MINDDMDSADPSDAAPQDDNGETGSRDEGHGPAGGPADRPAGTSEPRDYTSINPDDDNDNVGPAQA